MPVTWLLNRPDRVDEAVRECLCDGTQPIDSKILL